MYRKETGNTVVILIILITVLGLITLIWSEKRESQQIVANPNLQKSKYITKPETNNKTDRYIWKNFKLSFLIIDSFDINEKSNSITISYKNGKIELSTIGTNLETLDEYLKDIVKKNNLTFIQKEDITISNQKAIKTVRKTSEAKEELTYWIYNDYGMYFVSTTDKDLYSLTEEVARSIKFD